MANGDTATIPQTGSGSSGFTLQDLSGLLPAEAQIQQQAQPATQVEPSAQGQQQTIAQPTGTQQGAPGIKSTVKQEPAFFGMRVATQDGVNDFENYIKNGGDINQVPVYDRLAVALAKDPDFLKKKENLPTYYSLVYKPLNQQSAGEKFNQAVNAVVPATGSAIQNIGQGILNTVNLAKDSAELAFRKATGLVHDPGYETVDSRFANEAATQMQGTSRAFGEAWNMVVGTSEGLFQWSRPVAEMFTHDPESKEQVDRAYASDLQDAVAHQLDLRNLGNQAQDLTANAYKLVGAYGDTGQKIQNATPNEAAAEGIATVANPLNYVAEIGAGLKAVGAFKPILLDRSLQSMEEVAGATARKGALDATQILPENPGISAANPGYIEARNLQSQFAPAARAAAQDVTDKSAALNQVLTSSNKIAGDPGTATWFASNILKGGGQVLENAGNIAQKVADFPENFGNWVSRGNPQAKAFVTKGLEKALFGTALEFLGPVGGIAEAAIEHLPSLADSLSGLFKTAGKELAYGETTLPFGQRVAQGTKLLPKFMAQAIDSPALVTAVNLAKGGAAGAATGAVLGGLQEAGTVPGGGIGGTVMGAAQGGILGMAGAGFGQWQRFDNPNQYLLQARGDWKRYSDILPPAEKQNFQQLSPTNQLILAQNAQHFPGLKVNYVRNDPTAPSFHYFDNGGRSNIQINLANPDSVIRTTLAHELIHGATRSGMLPDIYDSLFGNPQTGKVGQFTALDAQGNPIGPNPDTGRYIANQDFNNLAQQYKNKMAQNGLPTAHLNDFAIAKEIYAENGVDYLMSGAPILDSNSAYRPALTSKPALKTALAKMGYTFDDNGRMIGAPGGPGGQVAGSGLFNDLQRNPTLQDLAQSYYTQTWRDGKINNEEEPTHRFTQRDMQNPNVAETWLNTAAEIKRNQDGTAQRDPNTGLPIYRTPREVNEYNANFTKAIRSGLEMLPEDQRADIGLRTTTDEKGRTNTFMRYLPDNIIDSLAGTNQYNPHQIASLRLLSRTLADSGNPGMEMRFFYNTALTAGKKYAGFQGREKIAVPYGIELTHDNQVNVKSVDFEQLNQNYQRVANRAPFKSLWDSPAAFAQDAHTYFTNHKEGRPGADAIGTQKRDGVNGLAGFGTQMHAESNPIVESIPQSVRSIVKSYRIDRMNQASATGAVRPFISEPQYYAMNRNYLPGAAEVSYAPRVAPTTPAPEPSQFPEAIPVTTRLDKDGKPQPVPIPYDITKSPLIADKYPQKLAKDAPDRMSKQFSYINPTEGRRLTALDDASAVTTFANRLVPMLKDWLKDPQIAPGKEWYDTIGDKLKGAFGKGANQFMEFLAATSPMKRPHENFLEAYEAKTLADQGHYDRHIDLYNKARDMMASDPKGFIQHVQDLTGSETPPSSQNNALAAYIDHHDILPLKANEQKYGFNSNAVLRVLADRWREDVKGPKTPQFNKNITGESDEATIDDWAARTLREIGYKGQQDQWRVQPASKTGVSNEDFAFGQLVFRRAAEKLGLKPKEAQALAWVGEQDKWVKNGWADIPAQDYDKPFDLAFPKEGPRLSYGQLREALKK